MLGRIPGLVTLGFLTTSKANAIRGAIAELLRWHSSSKYGREQRRVDDESLLSMLRTNPELMGLVEPLLTDEQIDLVTGAAAAQGAGEDEGNEWHNVGQT
jgi:hypothetical protein